MSSWAEKLGLARRRCVVVVADPPLFGAVADLHARSFSRGWSQSEIRDLAHQKECCLLVCKPVGGRSGEIFGFNLYRQAAGEAEILSIAVDPEQRRSGLAEMMMREAIFRLQADRADCLFLEVDGTNAAAVHLYNKLGFETVGTRPAYYKTEGAPSEAPRATALVMKLALR